MQNPELQPLNALVGHWTVEATHPMLPSTVVHGSSTFEWLEGEHFLIQRARLDHPDFPDAIAITGAGPEGLAMRYFDSRGVERVYQVAFDDGLWRMRRDAPGFSQRFEGAFGGDGNTISGVWELSRDDATWDDDLRITFRRAA